MIEKFKKAIEKFEADFAEAPEWFLDIFGNSIWEMIVSNGIQVVAVGFLGWLVASWFEKKHIQDMELRENTLSDIYLNTSKRTNDKTEGDAQLLMGSVVIAHDYFRTLIIIIQKLIGGNVNAYEKLLMRGRREAILRLKENAKERGLNKVINIRFGSSTSAVNFLTAVEIVAYGTGISTVQNKAIIE